MAETQYGNVVRRNITRTLCVGICIGSVLAACGGAGQNAQTIPSPCPLFPIPAPPQMIYPMPNATNVPDGNFSMAFTYPNGDIAAQWSPPSVTSSTAPTVTGGPYTIVPTPAVYEFTSAMATLQSGTAYSVHVVTPPQGGHCSTTATLGSFTTQ